MDLRYLLLIALLAACVDGFYNDTAFNSIHKRMRTASPSSVIEWDTPYNAIEDTLNVVATEDATYYWALQFYPVVGYCGLQFNLLGPGPSLHFAIWDIVEVPAGSTNCAAVTDSEGTFVKCHYSNFHWEMNRTYRRRIEHIGKNYFHCTIIDTVSGVAFTTDALRTPTSTRPTVAFQFFEYVQEIDSCDAQKYGRVTYTMPQVSPAGNRITNYIAIGEAPCPNICWATSTVATAGGTYSITCGNGQAPPSVPSSSALQLYNSHAPQLLATVTFKGGAANPERISYGSSSIATAVHAFARVTSASGGGFLTVWPSGEPAKASTLNYVPGETPTSTFTIALANAPGPSAFFMAYSHVPATVEFYIDGYFAPRQNNAPAGNSLFLHPLPRPLRLLDTRPYCTLSDGYVVPDCRDAAVGTSNVGLVGVPSSAQAVSLTGALISSGPGASALFGSTAIPAAKTSAPPAGTDVAVVEVSAVVRGDGSGSSWNLPWSFNGPVKTALDIDGYYDKSPVNGLGLELLQAPVRWIDTRPPIPGFPAVYVGEGALLELTDVRSWKICDKKGDVLVATVTTIGESPYKQGFVTIWPTGAQPPVVSQAQSRGTKDEATALGIHITCGDNGYVSFRANVPTHVVVDVTAVYRPYPDTQRSFALVKPVAVDYHDHPLSLSRSVADLKVLPDRVTCVGNSTPASIQKEALARINFWRKAAGQLPATLKANCSGLQAAAIALSDAVTVSHSFSVTECFPESARLILRSSAIAIVSESATGAESIDEMIWSRERHALLIPEASEFGFACAESKTRRVCVARATEKKNPYQSYVMLPRNKFATRDFPENALWSFASSAVARAENISVAMSSGSHTQQVHIMHTRGSNTIFWRIRNARTLPAGDYHITITGVGARKSYTVRLLESSMEKAEVGASSTNTSSAAVVAVVVVASVVVAVALVGVMLFVLFRRKRLQQRDELRQALQGQ